MISSPQKKLALVLGGGGARGAYEAGVIHFIRTGLRQEAREKHFDIQCGCSVGALNTAFMVSTEHDLFYQAKAILDIWRNVREENIYERNLKALFKFLGQGAKKFFLKIIQHPSAAHTHFPGFLNTKPFLPYISQSADFSQIHKNIQSGLVQAIALVATNVFTGRTELFLDKHPSVNYHGDYVAHMGPIQPIHTMASAAIPVIFPTVMINGIAYTDGGLRLNTPFSPAIHLGADSILVIGLNHRVGSDEAPPSIGQLGQSPALGQVMGRVMNAVFLDRIQYDIEQLERINRLIDWTEALYGKDYLSRLNDMLHQQQIKGDVADRGVKKINSFRIRPSEDIGEIFRLCFEKAKMKHFKSLEKFLIRILDIDPNSGVDFLSYISFIPEYLSTLIDLGYEDAKKRKDELENFLINA